MDSNSIASITSIPRIPMAFMDDHFLHRLETLWVPALQKICDRHAGEMKLACVELQKQLLDFQREKIALFSTMASVEGEEAAMKAFSMRLDDMLPSYLQQLLTLTGVASTPVPENGSVVVAVASPTAELAPAVSVQGPAATKTPNATATMGMTTGTPEEIAPELHKPPRRRTMASFFGPRQQDLITQKTPSPVLPEPISTTQPRPVSPTLSNWEVVGEEYLFQYTQFGPGWFVLRCDRGADTKPVTFLDPPLDKSGMRHFNMSSCRYHDRSKTYTRESMMEYFGRRVVDEDGEDVTDAWAADSNEMLAEKMTKRAKQKNKVPNET